MDRDPVSMPYLVPAQLTPAQEIRLEVFKVLAEQLEQWSVDRLIAIVLKASRAIETGQVDSVT